MIVESAKEAIEIEAKEIAALIDRVDSGFEGAVRAILACKGKTIVSGMGKSGLIGQKIAATLASTGTSAFFMHPAEAYHGDLGMVAPSDVALIVSNSGETDEALKIVPFLQDQQNVIVAFTGAPQSTLARAANFHVDCSVAKEACPLSLAPTSSTTAALVMGDALAIALMKARGFEIEHFARFHPGGSLGRKLLATVEREMIPLEKLPIVSPATNALDTLRAMSLGRLGAAIVSDSDGGGLLGVITDGDLRRVIEDKRESFFTLRAEEMMTKNPKTIGLKTRLIEAEELMDKWRVHQLIALDDCGKIAGLLPYRANVKKP
ncbi:MAG: KpsF/GutQ family sugar-phosphate isomerase [Helicobacteraceae bacterium]|jgi:arabinose-5-phosphate isomerase|nr:KpsF/GutQ family sugar-phosphate isomerase [Helicobacteraceae bacterium]